MDDRYILFCLCSEHMVPYHLISKHQDVSVTHKVPYKCAYSHKGTKYQHIKEKDSNTQGSIKAPYLYQINRTVKGCYLYNHLPKRTIMSSSFNKFH